MRTQPLQISVAAVAALAIVALIAVALFAAGGARAENTPTPLTYDSGGAERPNNPPPVPPSTPTPPPCPPNLIGTALDEVSSGHYGIFDVCWDDRKGVLVTNHHPPSVVHESGVTTRYPSRIDIDVTDIHITADHKLVRPGHPKAGTDGYYVVRADSPVWKAPGTGGEPTAWVLPQWIDGGENNAPLYLGFTAGLLNPLHWLPNPGTDVPVPGVEYEFEHFEHIGDGEGHAFVAHAADFNPLSVNWSTLNPDTNELRVPTGAYLHRSWLFTKPGTYIFQVHVKAHPNRGGPGSRFSSDYPQRTVTSEVREYRFHVGTLEVNEDPIFRLRRSVPENAAPSSEVGEPVEVQHPADENQRLTFTLEGDGKDDFGVSYVGGLAQIVVGRDANLDYETKDTYDLLLNVSDGKDHEGNDDPSVDDSIALKIILEDVPFAARLNVNGATAPVSAHVNDQVTFTATVTDPPVAADQLRFRWVAENTTNSSQTSRDSADSTWTTTSSQTGEWTYTVYVRPADDSRPEVPSNSVTVNWQPASN